MLCKLTHADTSTWNDPLKTALHFGKKRLIKIASLSIPHNDFA